MDDNTKAHRLAQIAITIRTKIKLKMPNKYVTKACKAFSD